MLEYIRHVLHVDAAGQPTPNFDIVTHRGNVFPTWRLRLAHLLADPARVWIFVAFAFGDDRQPILDP